MARLAFETPRRPANAYLSPVFIHTIVTAAIFIAALRRQNRHEPSPSTPDEDPPAYPALDGDDPIFSDEDEFMLDEERGNARKGDVGYTSVASSTTLTGPVVTPQSYPENDSDDYGEDHPLLRL